MTNDFKKELEDRGYEIVDTSKKHDGDGVSTIFTIQKGDKKYEISLEKCRKVMMNSLISYLNTEGLC